MSKRCSVCQSEQVDAVNAALQNNRSLSSVSSHSPFSRSALHRHKQHMTECTSAQPSGTVVPVRPVEQSAVIEIAAPATRRVSGQATGREKLAQRAELLWEESLQGLSATKEPVKVVTRHGVVELSDLRGRAGFLREGARALRLLGEIDGSLNMTSGNQTVIIVIPQPPRESSQEPRPVDIGIIG